MKNLRLKSGNIPFLFLITTVLAYGLLIPSIGFYWDDWPFAWIAKFMGPAEFNPAFAPFRPFLGPIFYFTTSLLPPLPIYWQGFALFIRFIMGFGTWWMLRQAWPERPRIALTAALLLIVFPGYSQHYIALTHINQELIPFIFYLFSFGYTFKALRAERPLTYIIIAVLLQICGIFPTEYFFGLEGMRALFLFFFFSGSLFSRVRETLKHWWPYLVVWILNALWLVYYYRFGPYNSYEVTSVNNATPLSLFMDVLDTLWKACLYIWIQVLLLVSTHLTAPSSILTLGLIAVFFVFISYFYIQHFEGTGESRSFSLSLMLIGVVGILLGRLPSLAAELPLRLQTGYDRFMISMMIGSVLFAIGLIELIFKDSHFRMYVVTAMIALGVGQQFYNANIFRRDWEKQSEIYWQLSWRIPALKPNTVLLTHQLPTEYEPDLSFTGPINWMYAPDYTSDANLPYALIFSEKRIGGPTLPSLDPDTKISFAYRTVNFRGSTTDTVVIYMPVNGCLRVLDPNRGDADIYSRLPDTLVNTIPLSNLSRIITDPEKPAVPEFLSTEPEHTWCYYFTKAELAMQMNDTDKVIALEAEAVSKGYEPEDPNEWLIFIEAHALKGEIKAAEKLSEKIIKEDPTMRRGVCIVWRNLFIKQNNMNARQIGIFMNEIKCSE
ncbi:MAG: hypothetical protein IPL71_13130 [Anaerolineales bacterium]|uniref:hypothetical protein n=1 Tax=Candidatus Villigracilis proximus TaxID=3140683 RepID=UPI003136EF80|nr:hypothetical protein [Anaerolineales bacterium]